MVHAHGIPLAFEDPARVLDVVTRLTSTHEAGEAIPWQVSDAPADYIANLLKVIVGIQIPVQRWVGKWKASQNRPAEDQQGVAAGWNKQASDGAVHMAAFVTARVKT